MTPSYRHPLPKWLTLWLPLFIVIYPFLMLVPALNWEKGLNREMGLVENLTALFLFVAMIVSLCTLRRSIGKIHFAWMVLMALGALFFLGEEISWGQHFFNWSTPEEWKEVNRQHETNIHNLNGTVEYLFTKVLRNILSTACVVGGLVIPLICRRLKCVFSPRNVHFWLWPSLHMALVGVLVNTVGLPSKIAHELKVGGPDLFAVSSGESKEAFIALFILLYVLTQYQVAGQLKQAQ